MERTRREKKKQELKKFDCILYFVYQTEVEPLTKSKWFNLSEEQLIDILLNFNIDTTFIKQQYAHYLDLMKKKEKRLNYMCIQDPKLIFNTPHKGSHNPSLGGR